jgi:hypothetical protein
MTMTPAWLPAASANLDALGFKRGDATVPPEAMLRRRLHRPEDDPWETLNLVQTEAGFSFELGTALRPEGLHLPRSGRIGGIATGTPVWTSQFEHLPPGRLKQKLDEIDLSLTPTQGLFRWRKDNGQMEAIQAPASLTADKRILLLVHGTFSHGTMYEKALTHPDGPGKDFLAWARTAYDEILLFNHPTLALPAWLNATELARHFDGCAAKIDVICHSRGGLVVRWWLDVLRPHRADTRVVYVAVPLAGTGLASPPRLTETLNYLANLAGFLGEVTDKVGDSMGWAKIFFTVGAGLMQLVSSIIRGAANLGIADAAVQMIPGFLSMARMSNNAELIQLRRMSGPADGRFGITSNHEPKGPGLKLWQYVTEAKQRLTDYGTDVLFAAQNDLVVDTASMDDLQEHLRISGPRMCNFGTSEVHHCSYFAQPRTYDFIRKVAFT